jgi:anti-sigma-K factor RskA
MVDERFAEDLPLHALGALQGEARKRLEEQLSEGSERLDAELEAWRSAAALLPYAAPPRPLPPELKERVMKRIETVKPSVEFASFPPPLPRHRMRWVAAIAASLLLAGVLGVLLTTARNEIGLLQSEKSSLASLLKEQERDTAWLKDPRVQISLLRGLAANPSASARLVWHPETKQGILYATGLPPLPLEKSYELWAFIDGQPQPAGVFQAAADGTTVFVLSRQEPLGHRPEKFAVSVEPKGGAPRPTGDVVLLGGPI